MADDPNEPNASEELAEKIARSIASPDARDFTELDRWNDEMLSLTEEEAKKADLQWSVLERMSMPPRKTTMPSPGNERLNDGTQFEELKWLCKLYNYELVEDPAPDKRKDGLGRVGLQDEVQLCAGRVIAVGPKVHIESMVYGISHELAHGIVGFCDEKDVLLEQTSILSRWVTKLLERLKEKMAEEYT